MFSYASVMSVKNPRFRESCFIGNSIVKAYQIRLMVDEFKSKILLETLPAYSTGGARNTDCIKPSRF